MTTGVPREGLPHEGLPGGGANSGGATSTDLPRGPLFGRLGFRLMAAVGLALMPLAVLSYVQARQFQAEAEARVQAALLGETLLAAAPQVEAIKQTRGAAAALAVAIQPVLSDTAACIALMQRYVRDEPMIVFAGFIPTDGRLTCGSTGEPVVFSGNAQLAAQVSDPQPAMNVSVQGRVSGEPVLIVSHPVRDAGDTLLGFVSLSMPQRAIEGRMTPLAVAPLSLMTFDADGTILTALRDIETAADRLPEGRELRDFVGNGPVTFSGRTRTGDLRTFAVVPMVENTLYILGSWPPARQVVQVFGDRLPIWAFPTAMWLASLVVAWIAAEHQALRPIRTLRRSITAFADGNRLRPAINMDHAPTELRDVNDAFDRLTENVVRDEAELEDTIHQKEVLLREVHHRVKNNLQLIASIMHIQMRKAASGEARALVKGLHDRVMSLATVHRELYQTTGLTDVKADELLHKIVTQVVRMGTTPGRAFEVTTSFDPIRLTPDQSVPLSLMLTEAVTNALKHGGPGASGRTDLAVSLTQLPGSRAALTVTNNLRDGASEQTMPPRADSTGMGEQLLAAFAMQLGGTLDSRVDGPRYILHLEFPIRALAEAEDRFAAAPAG